MRGCIDLSQEEVETLRYLLKKALDSLEAAT